VRVIIVGAHAEAKQLINRISAGWEISVIDMDQDKLRNRKLLLHKKEIIKLKSNTEKKGMTIVPLSLYLKGSWIKLTIGVGKGKKLHDKRQDEKQKSIKKEINSALKR